MISSSKITRILAVNRFPIGGQRIENMRKAEELWELVRSLGNARIIDMMHTYGAPHPGLFIGPKKAQEVSHIIVARNIDVVVINASVKTRQIHNLWRIFRGGYTNIEIWDRIDLILAIFMRHAHTSEAKLQIRLARMRHMGPRIYGMGFELSRQAGGIGTRGIGETNVERMKRHWRNEVHTVRRSLAKLSDSREREHRKRHRLGLPTVSIIGYTNAGKTALFNRLTGKQKFVHDYLFATLDSVVGNLWLPRIHENILISDTIGFIRDLPPGLIDSFRTTLLETLHAELLLHVVDMTDESIREKTEVVEKVLGELGITRKPIILVFSKADLCSERHAKKLAESYMQYHPVCVSAKSGTGIKLLIRKIEDTILKSGSRVKSDDNTG